MPTNIQSNSVPAYVNKTVQATFAAIKADILAAKAKAAGPELPLTQAVQPNAAPSKAAAPAAIDGVENKQSQAPLLLEYNVSAKKLQALKLNAGGVNELPSSGKVFVYTQGGKQVSKFAELLVKAKQLATSAKNGVVAFGSLLGAAAGAAFKTVQKAFVWLASAFKTNSNGAPTYADPVTQKTFDAIKAEILGKSGSAQAAQGYTINFSNVAAASPIKPVKLP